MASSTVSAVQCVPSELDIFSRQKIQNAVLGNQVLAVRPLHAVGYPLSTLEFHSSGSNDYYRDLSHVYLRMKVSLRDDDGGNMIVDHGVGVVNNLLFSLFRSMEVYLNEKAVCRIDNFGYKSYIETLLNNTPAAAETHLRTSMFYLDTPDKVNVAGDENIGFKKRKELLAGGRVCEMYGRLQCGIFNQPLLLPQGLDLRLKLGFAPESFYMWVPNDVHQGRINVLEATLFIKQVAINPGVLIAHAKILSQTNAVFPYKRAGIKTFSVGAGGRTLSLNNISVGRLPSSLVFCMVPNNAYNGDILKNPFAFVHKSCTNVSIFFNSEEYRYGPMDFHSNDSYFSYVYHSLFTGSGLKTPNLGHMITPEMFHEGSFMIIHDGTPDSSGHVAYTSLPSAGTLRIEVTFANEIDESLTCLVYLEEDAILEIDSARNVHIS